MNAKATVPSDSLLDELQATLAHGSVARRVESLRRITDLFVDNAVDCPPLHLALFDDVFQCLIEHIEVSAKALLSERLAILRAAPPKTLRTLVTDDAIEVAGPLLSRFGQLDDEVLIETAQTKSQAHLLAISIRKALSRAVTDILLLRGNEDVVHNTVTNPGAALSEVGVDHLIDRAEKDKSLANCLAIWPNLPRHLYLKLVAKASVKVRARLEAANPKQADNVSSVVRTVTRRARSAEIAVTKQTEIAHALVKSLYDDGRLDEQLIEQFAEEKKFDEANAAIAAMANIPVSVAETIMVDSRAEGVMILAKVAGMSWSTAKLLIEMRDQLAGDQSTNIMACKATYSRLKPSTAQQVLRFHRMQESTTTEPAE